MLTNWLTPEAEPERAAGCRSGFDGSTLMPKMALMTVLMTLGDQPAADDEGEEDDRRHDAHGQLALEGRGDVVPEGAQVGVGVVGKADRAQGRGRWGTGSPRR